MEDRRSSALLRIPSRLEAPAFSAMNHDVCYSYGVRCHGAFNKNVSSDMFSRDRPQHQYTVTSRPRLMSPPYLVVFRFTLPTENTKHADVCESPRSVLELRSTVKVSSPRSAVDGMFTSPRPPWEKKGVGLAIVAAMQAEEERHLQQEEKAKGRHAGKCILTSNQALLGKSQPISIAQSSHLPWNQNKHSRIQIEEDSSDEDDDDEGESESYRAGHQCRKEIFMHHARCAKLNVVARKEASHSALFTVSPVSNCAGEYLMDADFLQACNFCRRVLAEDKDIYMYRGDRAFCSPECRYQQILLDERKERLPVVANCYSEASGHGNGALAAVATAAAA